MHNKAYYKYVVEDATAQSKSYDKYNPGHKGAKGAKGAKVRHHPQPQSPFDAAPRERMTLTLFLSPKPNSTPRHVNA
jgi:hypothetical protein